MPVPFLSNPCLICAHDEKLKLLKRTITRIQKSLKQVWTSEEYEKHHYLFHDKRQYAPSLIPSYSLYSETWAKTLTINPLEYEWETFDAHDAFHRCYLSFIVPLMSDQMGIWSADSDHPVSKKFNEFFNEIVSFFKHIQAIKTI